MTAESGTPLVIVGDAGPVHVGRHLIDAARELGTPARLVDASAAFDGAAWRRRVAWWALGHRPLALRPFSQSVVDAVTEAGAGVLLATGLAPIDEAALETLGELGVTRANFLTDDPWNPAHRAPWFMRALERYDIVFTPRAANVDELRALGIPSVVRTPFGFNPAVHRPTSGAVEGRFQADVMCAGGADPDRVDVVAPLIRAGLDVALYGGYWDRYPATRAAARGFVDDQELPRAVAGARVCLGLVRRANRDGHSMRTFEVPAMGGCCLLEYTSEHEAIFGADGEAVRYFRSPDEAVALATALVADEAERRRLAARAHDLITAGHHTYRDRLAAMLSVALEHREDRAGHPGTVSRV